MAKRRKNQFKEMTVGEGENRTEIVLVPKRDFRRIQESRQGLLKRIFGKLRPTMKDDTSLAADEKTTDSALEKGGGTTGRSASSRWERIAHLVEIEETRQARYEDYERIDSESSEAERALNVYVKNAFQPMEGMDAPYEVTTEDERVEVVVGELDRRIKMSKILPEVARSAAMWGDGFEEIVFDAGENIVRVKWSNPKRTRRNEDEHGRLDAERAFLYTDGAGNELAAIPAFAMVHIRFRHKRGSTYGTSFYKPSRKPFRQLDAAENGILMDRLTRATDRIVFKIPIPPGTSSEDEEIIIQNQMDRFRRTSAVGEDGKVDYTYSPLADDEDIFIATYPDNAAEVERLMANSMTGEITDVKYFRTKFLGSFGVPPAFMGVEEDINAKATLNEQAVEFGRDIRAFQEIMAHEFMRPIYDRQLFLAGIIPEPDLYEIVFPPLGFVDELVRWQVAKMQWEIVALARGVGVPLEWLLRNVVMLGEEDVGSIMGGLDVQGPVNQFGPNPSLNIPGQPGDLEAVRLRSMENVHLRRAVEDLHSLIAAARRAKINTSISF